MTEPPTTTAADTEQPRIRPGSRQEIGAVNALIVDLIGLATGTKSPNLFTTLARHRGLFRRWLRFASVLMPGGTLPRIDTELVILRVAHNCACEYEWRHHELIGVQAGLAASDIQRVRQGAAGGNWTPRQSTLLRAADELHEQRVISDHVWAELREHLTETQLIELCMLVGHYEMLAMTLNSLGVIPDEPSLELPTGLRRLIRALANSRLSASN